MWWIVTEAEKVALDEGRRTTEMVKLEARRALTRRVPTAPEA